MPADDGSTNLMQEGNNLARSPFVRFRQVEVFEVEYQSFAVLRAVHAPRIATNHHTHLTEFLKDMRWRSLGTAVDDGNLSRPQLTQAMLQQQPGKHNPVSSTQDKITEFWRGLYYMNFEKESYNRLNNWH